MATTEHEVTLEVDDNGWVQIPGYIKIKPDLPTSGRVTGIKHWGGAILVAQETEAGPRLWRLHEGASSWEEIGAGQA